MRKYIIGILLLFTQHGWAATNQRSDTIDIQHIRIALNITDYTNQTIGGNTTIYFSAKMSNQQQLILDLLKMNIDSVKSANTTLPYTYDSFYLKINFGIPLTIGGNDSLTIYYHGHPLADPSGWGGFSFSGVYAYNLGVGFASDPHAFGRCWFPCFDNFTERSSYDFFITTDSTKKDFSNGVLMSAVNDGNGHTTWHWHMQQQIPSYLSSVAVAPYATVQQTYAGVNGNISIQLGALPADTTNLKNSFIHLPNALNAFENKYLPYQFDRVGYVLVPFSSGAMEHATNIAYPKLAADGSLSLENLYAHELSHHWWGDLVTCDKEEEMWLNEGWAAYSENIFYENVYGYNRYITEVKDNHTKILLKAHFDDNGYYPVAGVPHTLTYGTTVYYKGADMIHTLRSYMGDTLFFSSLNTFLERHKWKSMNTPLFRDSLSLYSGINLTDCFNDWILQPGFVHFSIGGWEVTGNTGSVYNVNIKLLQRQSHTAHVFHNVPVEVTFFDANWNKETKRFTMNDGCNSFNVQLNLNPVYAAVDFDEKLSDAISDDWKVISSAGNTIFSNAKMTINTQTVTDSVLLRVEHNFIRPEAMKNPIPGLHMADRYWKIDGIDLNKLSAKGTIVYDGTSSLYYLDRNFITNSEDSLVVLYRSSPYNDWSLAPSFNVNTQGSAANKKGSIIINGLQAGEYTMAIYDYHWTDTSSAPFALYNCDLPTTVSSVINNNDDDFFLSPNPAGNRVNILFNQYKKAPMHITVYNMYGNKMYDASLNAEQNSLDLFTTSWASGQYIIQVSKPGTPTRTKKLLIVH